MWSPSNKSLSDADREKLNALNRIVDDAIDARTAWLDSKMSEYSPFQVGDDIYSMDTLRKLGRVSRLYRFKGNGRHCDDSLNIDVEYNIGGNGFDNTSRQIGVRFGTKSDVEAELRRRVESFK